MKATLRHGVQALLVFLAVMAPLTVQAERKLLDQVVAIVDEDVILQTELEARINTIASRLRAQGTGLPPRQVLEERVLDQLITDSIQMQMADRAGMRISDNELNETMANIADRNGMALSEFEAQLEAEGVTYNQAREQIRKEMLTSRVQQRQVGTRVRVTDREVENYLESQEARGNNGAEYRLAYIFVSVDDPSDEAEMEAAREKAERLRSEIAQGRDFREVAVAESDASNALEGGDMGWRAEGQLPSLVAPVVPDLAVGEPSPVLENNSGFHLVMVMDKRGGEQKQVIQQHRVRHILVRPSEATTDSQAEARIRDLYQQLQNGAGFSALAKEYSDDPVSGSDGGNLGWVSPGQMVPAFEQAMTEADVGEFRGPFRSQFGWHILQVQERRQKDISGEVRESEARQAIYRRKFETELQNWLREIRDEAFVEFKGEYANDAPAEEEPVS
ncbi:MULTISPECIES: peptidylprolyl isomerase [Marinobacter]|uniref:Chaperone SurA n=1 Tax=Marinobacter metalliresistant TaxID=2961995 RepID=A0ABZ2VWQ5_9GAMM|nr:peptidylprolyl isomerase [Marinobacter sp. Arc7-DN-1]AXS85262.1 molecular chaperone SurA [Marinobacter sp. Arc7-DN-1]